MFLDKSITNFIDKRNSFFVTFRHNSTHQNTLAFVRKWRARQELTEDKIFDVD
jgi:hypothetical protein